MDSTNEYITPMPRQDESLSGLLNIKLVMCLVTTIRLDFYDSS